MTEADRFYRERDSRTANYLGRDVPTLMPVSVHASADACQTHSGQLLLTTLVNQLARIHRELHFVLAIPDTTLFTPTLCGSSNLGDEIIRMARRIDPYGKFELDRPPMTPSDVSIGVGAYCQPNLTWYLGCDRSNAELGSVPCRLGRSVSSDLRGASLAALLGAAATTKAAFHLKSVPTTVSAWNFKSGAAADPGPEDLPSIDVGRALMVGAGAVTAAVVYWLMQWGNRSSWTTIDRDIVKLHNTNRSLLFFPDDAGWLVGQPCSKVESLSRYLSCMNPVHAWYDEALEAGQVFDTVLVLANERDVRTRVSARNDPVQLQATTGRSWLSQLHRHISGRDDCVRCRMSDISTPHLACSEGATTTTAEPERPDAALPFLSGASGLMLASALQRLQLGEFGRRQTNVWSWDFRNSLRMHSSGYYECRSDCSTVLAQEATREIAGNTRWANAPWLVPEREKDVC